MENKKYRYYQPNKKDLEDRVGDCSVRALTKFFDITWLEAFDKLCVYARQTQQMVNALPNIKLCMEDKDIPYVSIYKPKGKKVTVLDFAKEHKTGKYILYVRVGYSTHLTSVVEGIIYDTWDCSDRIVYGYWH